MTNIYVELTKLFNQGSVRAILSSGQAVVLHRLAIMSKDGDWIVREDATSLAHVLLALSDQRAGYRFGAPLDVRWLKGGWSSHFEFRRDSLRIRTDFVTRPPRIPAPRLSQMWLDAEGSDVPFASARDLADIKKTNREKDYAVIGELARLVVDPTDQLLVSRSARDLVALAEQYPELIDELLPVRPVLDVIGQGVGATEVALDAERRDLIHANEARLRRYWMAADAWSKRWPAVAERIRGLPLSEAHEQVVSEAQGVLPFVIDDLAGEPG